MFGLLNNSEGQQTSALPHRPPACGAVLHILCFPLVETLRANEVALRATWHSRTFSWQHQTDWT